MSPLRPPLDRDTPPDPGRRRLLAILAGGAAAVVSGCTPAIEQAIGSRIDAIKTVADVAGRSLGECNRFAAEQDALFEFPREVYEDLVRHTGALAVRKKMSGFEMFDIEGQFFVVRRQAPEWAPTEKVNAIVTSAHVLQPVRGPDGRWRATAELYVLPSAMDAAREDGYLGVHTDIPPNLRPEQHFWRVPADFWTIDPRYDPTTGAYDVAGVALGLATDYYLDARAPLPVTQRPLRSLAGLRLAPEMPAPYAQTLYHLSWEYSAAGEWSSFVVDHGTMLDTRRVTTRRSTGVLPTSFAGKRGVSGGPVIVFDQACPQPATPLLAGMNARVVSQGTVAEGAKVSTGSFITPAGQIASFLTIAADDMNAKLTPPAWYREQQRGRIHRLQLDAR